MIYVYYLYFRKKDNTWQEDVKTFEYVYNAYRFIMKCRHNHNMRLIRYACDNSEDSEFLNERC